MYRIGFLGAGAIAGTLMIVFSDIGPREAPVHLTSIDPLTLDAAPTLSNLEPAEIVIAETVVLPAPEPDLTPQVVEIATRATADPFDTLTLLPNPVVERAEPAPLQIETPQATPAVVQPIEDFETAEQAMLARMERLDTAPILTTHVVQRGESLTAISKQYYGNFTGYVYIFEANRGSLQTPEALAVGMELQIPNIDEL